VRQDGFFAAAVNDRSAAEEIIEAVLLAGQRESQEKKLRYYGNLLGNIPFHPEVDRAQANLLIRMAVGLSYRQLCLLAVFKNRKQYTLGQGGSSRGIDYLSDAPTALLATLQETYNLHTQALVRVGHTHNMTANQPEAPVDIVPANVHLYPMGRLLHDLMELEGIASEDLQQVATLLR
jgi:hypothetical protein